MTQMRNAMRAGLAVSAILIGFSSVGPAAEKSAVLASLPSAPGPHIARIRAMQAGEWLKLGAPAPDPRWGPAPGRAYTNKMAYAPDLLGAFLIGEGVHGQSGSGPREGHYNDDVFFYDLMTHRYICVYPGTKVADFKVTVDANGFLADEQGQNPPMAIAVHGYECSSYNPDTGEFMTLQIGSPYSRKIRERIRNQVKDTSLHTSRDGGKHPFFYLPKTGQWQRRKVDGPGPRPGAAAALVYLPSLKKTAYYERGGTFWLYDHAERSWTQVSAKGGRPAVVPGSPSNEGTLCYDSKRDRLYVFNRNQLSIPWAYDCKTNTFTDLKAANQVYPATNDYEQGRLMIGSTASGAHYDTTADVVVMRLRIRKGKGDPRNLPSESLGLGVYDPVKNAWEKEPVPLPPDLERGSWNSFYSPELNVHVYHIAGDSRTNGRILLYRHKK